MTPLAIAVLSTSALVAWLLWLEHREELSASGRMRNEEHFSTEDKTGRVRRRDFDDGKWMQIKYKLHDHQGSSHVGANLPLPNTLNIAWRGDWGKEFCRQGSQPAPSGAEGAAPDHC
jgi:hypothetical protein